MKCSILSNLLFVLADDAAPSLFRSKARRYLGSGSVLRTADDLGLTV